MLSHWHKRFMQLAWHIAGWSKDPSTQVGAVIVGVDKEVLSLGYNGFPRGMDDAADLYADRAFKYEHIIHAEHNAVLNAARNGLSLKGATLYVTHPPCPHCLGTIKQSGIGSIIYDEPSPEFRERWPLDKTINHASRCGIRLFEHSGGRATRRNPDSLAAARRSARAVG